MANEFIARNGIVALNNSIITGSLDIAGNLTTTGTITAQKLVVQQVTSSVLFSSGSNVFGNSISNTQSMTGSVGITGSLSINGVAVVANSVSSFNTRSGSITLSSGDVTTALGYTPYNATNPNGYTTNTGTVTSVGGTGTVSGLTLSGTVTSTGNLTLGGTLSLTSGNVTTALGFTPYNATNPSSYITTAGARAALSFTAGSGAYNTTSGVITIPTNTNQLTNGAGYTTNTGTVTSVGGTGTVSGLTLSGTVTTTGNLTLGGTLSLTSGNVTTALGFTPYNATNPSGYITSAGSISGNAATATITTFVSSPDGDRIAGNKLPTGNPRAVRYDFANASSVTGATGNYAGVMTYAPWDGTSASTGDSSYQLAFVNESGVNAGGIPGLKLRNGINSTWNSTWYQVLHSGNYTSYAVAKNGSSWTPHPSSYRDASWNTFYTDYGYIQLGPANAGTAHIYTDRPSFYFNQQLLVLGSTVYHTGNLDAPNKAGTSYYQANTWIQLNGYYGLYWPNHFGAHFSPNDISSHTQFSLRGSKNSYGGIYDQFSQVTGIMYDASGNGGVYREANGRWYWYYLLANNCMGINTSTTSSSYGLYVSGGIYSTGDIVAYSDARKKTNVVTVDNALNTVLDLRGVFYSRIDDETNKRQIGVIAQETEKVLPEVVTYASDIDEYGVSYGNMGGLFIEAIKELATDNKDLRQQIEELKNYILKQN
jgi:hypothetical protein